MRDALAEAEPVLVVHGVSTRDQPNLTGTMAEARSHESFAARVRRLNAELGNEWQLMPVYWGDIGPAGRDVSSILPVVPEPSTSKIAWLATGLWHGTVGQVTYGVKRAVYAAKQFSAWLADDKQTAAEMEKLDEDEGNKLMDQFIAFWLELAVPIRSYLTARMLPFVGDIIVYHSSRGRGAIQARVTDALSEIRSRTGVAYGTREHPIAAITHSLGGVICLDMAVSQAEPIWLRTLITMGSQPSFFHLMDENRYGHLPSTPDGQRLLLPLTIGSWTNLVDAFDPLAFLAASTFRVQDGRGPHDIFVRQPTGHGAYWTDPQVISAIRDALTCPA